MSPVDVNTVHYEDGSSNWRGQKKPYAETHYLLFGASDSSRYLEAFDTELTKDYLEKMGVSTDSPLSQARTSRGRVVNLAGYREPTDRFCDFCGKLLTGAEYDVLKDGRERCGECSATVVKGQESYEALFKQTRLGLMEKYGIDFPAHMTVQVVSAKKLAKLTGKAFVPTRAFDARAVGVATFKRGEYGIAFENGSPRLSLIGAAAHELTHIWQYSHWGNAQIKAKYGERSNAIYEGMAKWAEIQYLYLINEPTHAERLLENEVRRTDVYGFGLRLFLNQYPLSTGIFLEGDSPFNHIDCPL